MKKVLLVTLVIFTITSGFAQTEKGKMFIGGNINITGRNNSNKPDSLESEKVKSFSFQINPNVGYFIKDNFAVGINLNFGIANSTQNYNAISGQLPYYEMNYKDNSITYGGGVFARRYFKIADKFFFLLNGNINYNYQTLKDVRSCNDPNYVFPTDYPATQKSFTKSFGISVNPGLVYFVSPKLGIQTSFGNIFYNNSTSKNTSLLYDNTNNTKIFGANLNISTFSIGLNYYF